MRKFLLLATIVVACVAWFAPQPEAKAEPVTLALLAPIAIEAASTAAPYVIRWLGGVGKAFLKMGKDVCQLFLLPVGLCELIFVAPFYNSCFMQSIKFMWKGIQAPFWLCVHTLLLPVAFCGISLNSR